MSNKNLNAEVFRPWYLFFMIFCSMTAVDSFYRERYEDSVFLALASLVNSHLYFREPKEKK